MRILLLNTHDRGGGAARIAYDLMRTYRAKGHEVRMLVRYKATGDTDVEAIDPYSEGIPGAQLLAVAEQALLGAANFRGKYRLIDWMRRTAAPGRWVDSWSGREDFNYSYSHHLVNGTGWRPDVVHLHNLFGDYFDLSALATISRKVPVIWTLHDTWALSGHCAYFIDCQRWLIGCGSCPDLERPPMIRRDATAENWRRKQAIYADSRLAVATPSSWLMDQVEQSMLRPWQSRMIGNGIDLTAYRPAGRAAARAALGLPQEAFICMFAGYETSSRQPYKDLQTIERAVHSAAERSSDDTLRFVCVGRRYEQSSDPRMIYPGYIADSRQLALYYQAADLLLHAAQAEVFGLVIAEALACGTPVLATAVGGIPELIVDGVHGWLVPRGDSAAMADRLLDLMHDRAAVQRAGAAGAVYARQHFDLQSQAQTYLDWFEALRMAYDKELP